MHLIVYTSEYKHGTDDISKVLADIVSKSKESNPKFEITGLLFYHNSRFVQFIEGEQEPLEQLMEVLEKDPRHKNIERIIDQKIRKRGFEQWKMDSFNLSEIEEIDKEELKAIREAYKKSLLVDSAFLVSFYKAMLTSHKLKPKNNN